MDAIVPAIVGATASALLMLLANVSNRRERDIREIFRRLNTIEKELARHSPRKKWGA
jgi:hypothetical protein